MTSLKMTTFCFS